eukprot:6212918-Pleurochrysis_carterae.AAC.2
MQADLQESQDCCARRRANCETQDESAWMAKPFIFGAVRAAVARPPPNSGARAMRCCARIGMQRLSSLLRACAATKRVATDEAIVVEFVYSTRRAGPSFTTPLMDTGAEETIDDPAIKRSRREGLAKQASRRAAMGGLVLRVESRQQLLALVGLVLLKLRNLLEKGCTLRGWARGAAKTTAVARENASLPGGVRANGTLARCGRAVAATGGDQHGIHRGQISNVGHIMHGRCLAAAHATLDRAHPSEVTDEVELKVHVDGGPRGVTFGERDWCSVLGQEMFNIWQVGCKQLLSTELVVLESHSESEEVEGKARLGTKLGFFEHTCHKLSCAAASSINLYG